MMNMLLNEIDVILATIHQDEEGTIVFSYHIYGNSTTGTQIITRQKQFKAEASCNYPQNTKVSAHFKGGLG